MPSLPHRSDTSASARGSSGLLRSYEKALFWRRLILASFFTVFVATLLYVIPWLPYGLSEADYNSRITLLMVLLLMASLLAFAAVYLRDISDRVEQTMLTWNTVNDGLNDMRRREYFFDRIVLECSRSGLMNTPFTVVAMRLTVPQSSDSEKISRAIAVLEPVVRQYDCLSSLGPHEIAVLAHGVDENEAPILAANLAQIVSESFKEVPEASREVAVGYAVFDLDSNEAGALIGIARERLLLHRQTLAAAPEAIADKAVA